MATSIASARVLSSKGAPEVEINQQASRVGSSNSVNKHSASNPAKDCRQMRRLIAEDPEWSLATVPKLVDISIEHLTKNFEHNAEILNSLLPKHKDQLLAKISTNTSLKVTALLVNDESFWKRCCQARWTVADVDGYDGSWKRMYFERHLQNIIENFIPESTDPTELNENMPLCSPFVKRLVIRQLLPPVREAPRGFTEDDISEADASDTTEGPDIDHFEFSGVLQQLPHLTELSIVYGVRDAGMNFEWNLFQFTARDCLLLAKCVAKFKNLKIFRLNRSKVDDDKIRVFISHILDHPSLVELDLNHNMIGDRGARAIGKFLNNHSKLVKISVYDNNIKLTGAQAIAHALAKNTLLKSLNLRLNRLGDEGGQAICRALLKNTTLEEINLASNELTEPTASLLQQVVMQNQSLTRLELSCNRFGPEGGKTIQEGMTENNTIVYLDLRLTEVGQESEYCISQKLHVNQEKSRAKLLGIPYRG